MQFNNGVVHGMVVSMLPLESARLILLEWIMNLQEKSTDLVGMWYVLTQGIVA